MNTVYTIIFLLSLISSLIALKCFTGDSVRKTETCGEENEKSACYTLQRMNGNRNITRGCHIFDKDVDGCKVLTEKYGPNTTDCQICFNDYCNQAGLNIALSCFGCPSDKGDEVEKCLTPRESAEHCTTEENKSPYCFIAKLEKGTYRSCKNFGEDVPDKCELLREIYQKQKTQILECETCKTFMCNNKVYGSESSAKNIFSNLLIFHEIFMYIFIKITGI
ncbi:unnamed protein product [Brassicogethes aeneus]|uniref:Uncharacterized protein n=1 Tax=Brassicogethes aeneus TaxID=1431903 RepID=A0A9P0FRF0_BRAAE|nr:unnamed protein product [Brassicogethes aeneus]